MGRYKNVFFIILLVFIFIEVLIIFPNRIEKNNSKESQVKDKALSKKNKAKADEDAEQRMKGIQLFESQQGQRDWDLTAEVAESFKSKGSWELKKLKIQFYSKDQVEFIVVGDYGVVEKSKNIQIKGNVVTKSKNGYQLMTPTVTYDASKRLIYSVDKVNVLGPNDMDGRGLQIKGKGFEASIDENRMTILNDVEANKEMQTKGTQFDIISKKAEFSGQVKEFKFSGNVKINYRKMKISGEEALFNYGEGQKSIQTVVVSGGVKISDDFKYATSERVKFDLNKDQYTFTGSPKVVQNQDEISGDQIIFLNGGKKVKVEKIKGKIEKLEQ